MASINKAHEPSHTTLDEQLSVDCAREQREYSERKLASNRAMRRGYSRVKFGESKPGDYTHNTPSLRKDAKFRNRLELSDHTFLLVPRGKCVVLDKHGYVDKRMTSAVLQHYRHIMASRKPYTYPAE